MAELPPLSSADRSRGSREAARVRRLRAQICDDLASGQLTLVDLLMRARVDPIVGRIRTETALKSLRGVGPVKAATIMQRTRISTSRTLAGLGPRQRERLIEEVS